MGRLLVFTIFLMSLISCAKQSGFRAENLDFKRVEKLHEDDKGQSPAKKSEPAQRPPRGTVVKNSNRITFEVNPKKTKWENEKVTVTANMKVGDQTYENVEFTGVQDDGKVVLEPTDPKLTDKFKANLYCNKGLSCSEFFIDVLFQEDGVVYHDQILATEKTTETDKEKKGETKEPPKSSEPSKPNPEEEEADEEIQIADDLKDEDKVKMGYVGTSDEEIRDAFKLKPPPETNIPEPGPMPTDPTPEPTPEPTPAPPAPIAPAPAPTTPPPKTTAPAPAPTTPQPPAPAAGAPTPAAPQPAKNPAEPKKDQGTSQPTPVPTAPAPTPTTPTPNFGDVFQLSKLRMKNQVYVRPDKGWLEKATDFNNLSANNGMFFFIAKPKEENYFGSFDLAQVLASLGDSLQKLMPGRKLAVTQISSKNGGKICFMTKSGSKKIKECHASHQNGVDADVRYIRHDETQPSNVVDSRGQVTSNFLAEKQWKLFKDAFSTNQMEVIFVGPAVKKSMCDEARRVGDYRQGDQGTTAAEILRRLYPESGHNDHFHIRVKCSGDNPHCEKIEYRKKSVGC